MRRISRYGWTRDLPDQRDRLFLAPAPAADLPAAVDLRPAMPGVYNQGDLGSCTAQAIGAAFAFVKRKQKAEAFAPSRLFVYYNERALEGTVGSDAGAHLRDGFKTIAALGVCPESLWPHNPALVFRKPLNLCYAAALNHQAISYTRIAQTVDALKGCLAAGFPFAFGMTVYESFESERIAKSGLVNLPAKSENLVGGHALLAVGYESASQLFIVRNSWGPAWGKEGYCLVPFEYLHNANLAADFWTLRLVE